ncbi:MAG: hypothetical protein V3S29_01020, partial [bacterium]
KNAKKMAEYFVDVFPVADFLYLLGKSHMNTISRNREGLDSPFVRASAQDLTISEKLFAAAARVGHAEALFELATFYSSPAGTMESHNTAINLFYKAGLAFLQPPGNLAKASEATEGIIRLKTDHLLARVLNCKIVEPPDSTDCAKLLVKTPVRSQGPEAQPAAEPQKLESPPLVSTTLFGVLNTRETAQSAYVVRRESYFSFGTGGGTDRERGLLRVLGPNYLPNYTIGFDFTMQLSLALTTNYFNLQPEVVGLRGQPFSLTNDLSVPATVFTVTEADFRFFQLTLYYYPHRFVYLGIANFSGELEANGTDSASVEQVEKFPVSDNLMVLGFTYDIFNPNYGRSRDPLAFKKNTGTWLVNLEFAVPFKSDTSIMESIASFGIGYRFF